jgi:hypothetical protein
MQVSVQTRDDSFDTEQSRVQKVEVSLVLGRGVTR